VEKLPEQGGKSMKLKKFMRWLLVIAITVIIIVAASYGIVRCFANWQQHQPLLVIVDGYGDQTKIWKPYQAISVSGPAKVWSPRYDIGIWEDGWKHPKFQMSDVSVALKKRGGKYTFYLQPTGWGGIDRDLRHEVGEITIDLN
jgi:hypothetical protein